MFNWFKRFQQPAETPETPDSVESNSPLEVSPEELGEDTPAVTTPATDDYLAWAKAAYQNIQKQEEVEKEEVQGGTGRYREVEQLEEVQGEGELEKLEELPELEELGQVAEEIGTIAPELALIEPEITSEIISIEPVEPDILPESTFSLPVIVPEVIIPSELEPEPESIEESVIAIESVAQEVSEIVETPLPFWARETETERLARLESLVVEEAEILEAVAEVITTPTPSLEFDESFLWSAQVLAAQGRRPEDVTVEEISWLKRLRQGLEKTRLSLINQLKSIVGQGPLDQDAVEAIESLLLQADVGVEATDYIITTLQTKLRQEILPPDQAIAYLKQILRDLLDKPYQSNYTATFVPDKDTLNIWLMTGVNGAGKTTTIGKLAHLAQKSGYSCLIGAADTFRAAAVEQVKIWGARSGTEVIANPGQNTDPGSVVFDAIAAAQARNTELLLIDTAGRLQNKKNLMDELGKIRRIVDKKAPNARVESLLVLDATLGQNGLVQAQVFAEAAKLSGVVLTKLDGTAKGGVALAVVKQLGLPIRFIGAGEGIEDLRPFSSYEFVEALLNG